ncbi:MAG TPA: TA system VapC family ribonuclease toxin [Thermoanaerobaculia bacterium]|nr:TA system VapC family ribonuclease toxin [Thermoanaerobaculia bacterium]
MLAVETNVLVYAHRRETAEHAAASALLRELAEGPERWAIPWPCVYEFASVATNRRIWQAAASTPTQAWAQLRAWQASPTCSVIGETEGFFDLLQDYVRLPRVHGPVVHDARIAAICVAHGVEALLSRDRDFSLFPQLTVRNPFSSG